ncbi:2-aminoethylphosphonate aminotransferase [Natroniella sp. ANB-PHB2]|uniref:2-aminoethylphosphonate aminotransferase n=1 Tax=Natroniella sp. ANB-PHB2 TaxID=3384444 RepID=UPI0038D4E1C0
MIRTAVILAAGMGSRLRNVINDKPKGFLVLDEKPIIEETISKLIEVGIEDIIIGTGYLHKFYDELAEKYPQITCVYNHKFETTGSMYTFYLLRHYIEDDFLLLESDLIFEKMALNTLLNNDYNDIILASGKTNLGDEVYIEVSNNNLLVNMSKESSDLNNFDAELVGISKISYSTFQRMCSYGKKTFTENLKLDYEEALVNVSKENDVFVDKIEDLVWCEIDNEFHYKNAISNIYPKIKDRERMNSVKRNILLNPGPATTTDSVKYAQIVPDICPREEEFGRLMKSITNDLTNFVANVEEYTTVLFGGSGTAAVEAILSSVVGDNKLLIINNGAYGKRMCEIAKVYGLNFIEFNSEIDDVINFQILEKYIKDRATEVSHLAVVHNETTTGLLNDIEAIGQICKKYDIELIVDGMSSYGAIPIDMKKMNISYLAASSNKNLQGMAGVSFVIANKNSLKKTKDIKARSFYLDLYKQHSYFEKKNQTRFTPPVQTIYSLKQAILETKMEGIKSRYQRYSKSWQTLINGIEKLGLKCLIPKEYQSRIITAIIEPDCSKYDFNEMHDYCYNKGYTIYPGKLDNKNTFRVANIGDINYQDIEKFISLLKQYLQSIDYI